MTVRLRVPTFEEIQWTGANLPTIESFVDDMTDSADAHSFRVVDGALFISPISVAVSPNGYLVFGPIYGTDKTQAGWSSISAAEFTAQYQAV